jgi:phosphoglycolate phosphatase
MNSNELFWRCDAVVFDLDGTLAQTLDGLHVSLNEVLCEHGYRPVSQDEVRGSMHGGFAASVQAALKGIDVGGCSEAAVTEAYRARYREKMIAKTTLYPGVWEVLEAQRIRGCLLAVCTNRDELMAVELLEGLGLLPYFSSIVGLSEGSAPKPNPMPLIRALDVLGIGANHALMVGDSIVDVACAMSADMPCLLFEGGYGATELPPNLNVSRFCTYEDLLRERSSAVVVNRPAAKVTLKS